MFSLGSSERRRRSGKMGVSTRFFCIVQPDTLGLNASGKTVTQDCSALLFEDGLQLAKKSDGKWPTIKAQEHQEKYRGNRQVEHPKHVCHQSVINRLVRTVAGAYRK